jgi:hypothetical protein
MPAYGEPRLVAVGTDFVHDPPSSSELRAQVRLPPQRVGVPPAWIGAGGGPNVAVALFERRVDASTGPGRLSEAIEHGDEVVTCDMEQAGTRQTPS